VAEVGFVAKNERVGERFESWGLLGVPPRQGLTVLARLLHNNFGQAAILNVDWERWRPPGNTSIVPPRFQDLYIAARDRSDQGRADGTPLRSRLLQAERSARKEMLQEVVADKVAKILGTTVAKMDVNQSITDMGLDSLVGMELRNWIESELQVSISIVGLTQGLSVVQLTELVLGKIFPEPEADESAPAVNGASHAPVLAPAVHDLGLEESPEAMEEHLDRLPEDEVDSLLAKMLIG
jgi:aryl carrier-like protein